MDVAASFWDGCGPLGGAVGTFSWYVGRKGALICEEIAKCYGRAMACFVVDGGLEAELVQVKRMRSNNFFGRNEQFPRNFARNQFQMKKGKGQQKSFPFGVFSCDFFDVCSCVVFSL